jgi:type II secretory pathway component GspD/PulD (secretin)
MTPSGDEGPAAQSQRLVWVVQHGSAKDLAAVLAKHFQDVIDVQALPDPSSNCLLIRAAPPTLGEVVKLLEQLDRRPQVVAVELLISEIPERKSTDGKPLPPDKELDGREFSGPAAEVVTKLEALRSKGLIGSLKRIQLTTVEGQAALSRVGESKPVVTGITATGTGKVSRMITYRNTGTEARVTPRVSPDKVITLDLVVEDARLYVPEDGITLGNDENGRPIIATEFLTSTLNTKLSLSSGQAVAAEGVKTTAKSGQSQTLIVVTARVVEPDAKLSN